MRRVIVWLYKLEADGPRYLLLKKSHPKIIPGGMNDHQPVTGHCRENEAFEEAAIRETNEETGVPASRSWLRPLNGIATFRDDPAASYGYQVHENQDVVLSKEHGSHRWLNFQEITRVLEEEGSFAEYRTSLNELHATLNP